MRRKPLRRSKRILRKSKKRKLKQIQDLEVKAFCLERDGGKCVVPERYGSHGGTLQAAHILSKGRWPTLRHVPENVVIACWRHHFHWMHKDPLEVADWFRETYPERELLLRQLRGL